MQIFKNKSSLEGKKNTFSINEINNWAKKNPKIFWPISLVLLLFLFTFLFDLTGPSACDCANIVNDKNTENELKFNNAFEGNGSIDFENDKWIKKGKQCMKKFTKMKEWEIDSYQSMGNFISDEAIENAKKECQNK